MKKLIYLLVLVLIFDLSAHAQNRISYSQYMHNQGVFNPAYFSLDQQFMVNAYYRKQWVGIDGAPTTKSLVAGIDLTRNHHLNLNIYQDDITVFKDLKIGLGYQFRVETANDGMMSFGVRGDYGRFQNDLASLAVVDQADAVLSSNIPSQNYYNIGVGYYFESPYFFFGFTAPHLFNNAVLKPRTELFSSFKFNHIYATIGGRVEGYNVTFFPTAMIKKVGGSPFQFDFNANFLLNEQVWLSGGLRTDKTIIFSAGYVMNSGLKLVYSYDLAALSNAYYSAGSHEISVGYGLSFYQRTGFSKKRYVKGRGRFRKRFGGRKGRF